MGSAANPEQEVLLADLLMLQMTGRLDEFMSHLNNGTDIPRFLEAAWGTVTTPKLFEEIVNRSVEAQVGEKHVALRELGQNALDAYDSKDHRPVDITASMRDGSLQISVTDKGKGMSSYDILRDLLIPYNSGGKELDPEKIGEHGIGWFSVLDLAAMVDVYSRKESHVPVHAQVQRKNGRWIARVGRASTDELAGSETGTKVVLNVPHSLEIKNIADFVNLYLGYVDGSTADIRFNGRKINTLSDSYTLGGNARIVSRGIEGKLNVFLSTRHLTATDNSNDQYRLRDVNLERMLYTQNGLFVRFDMAPFGVESFHFSFFRQLAQKGIDFWVDIPPNIRLTTGRSNVIADDVPALLKALYTAFEDTIIESVLPNDLIMDKCRNSIEDVLAKMFKKRYSNMLEQFERSTYSRTRRIYSKTAYAGMEAARIVSGLARAAAAGITSMPMAARYITGIPHHIGNAARRAGEGIADISSVLYESLPGILQGLGYVDEAALATAHYVRSHWWTMTKIGTGAGTTALLGYEAYANRHFLSYLAVRLLAFALLGGGAALAARYRSEIRQITANAVMGLGNSLMSRNPGYRSWSEKPAPHFTRIASGLGRVKMSIEDRITRAFSMASITKKRVEMVRRRTENVGRLYLSRLHVDGFTKRVASKNIVRGGYAWLKGQPENARNSPHNYAFNPTRISVDELVRLFALNKVQGTGAFFIKEGDFMIDQSSSFTMLLYEQLLAIRKHVQQDYNPRVIEDYLRDIKTFFGETLSTVYDIFHPSTWGKYHSALGKIDHAAYNPSIIARSGASIRWMVNHSLGVAGGLAGIAANPATYAAAAMVAGHAASASWRGASGAFKRATARKKREPAAATRIKAAPPHPDGIPTLRKLAASTLKTAAFAIALPCYVMKELLVPANYLRIYRGAQNIRVPFLAAHAPAAWKGLSSLFGAGADFFIVEPSYNSGKSIMPISGNRISSIAERTGLGWEYLSVYRTVSRMEELLSEASGLPARNVQMHMPESSSHYALHPPKYGAGVLINLNGGDTNSIINSAKSGKLPIDSAMLTVFSQLLHEKSHQKVGITEHDSNGAHRPDYAKVHALRKKGKPAWFDYGHRLYDAKDEILAGLASLLSSRGATMESELSPFFQPASDKPQPIPVEGLIALSRMTPGQLDRVRANLEKGMVYVYDPVYSAFCAAPPAEAAVTFKKPL